LLYTFLSRTASDYNAGQPARIELPDSHLERLKALHDSKSKSDMTWKEKVFGGDPFKTPQFIGSGVEFKKLKIWIPLDVQIELISETRANAFSIGEIEKLIENLLANDTSKTEAPSLHIDLVDEDFRISSQYCRGSVTRLFNFNLYVRWNFATHLAVVWIDSTNRVTFLFPISDLEAVPPVPKAAKKGYLSIKFPRSRRLTITSPPGIETCLVICREVKFDQALLESISGKLRDTLGSRNGSKELPGPEFMQRFPEPRNRPILRRRLGLEAEHDGWEKVVIQAFAGLADSVYIFDIPNR